MPTFQHNIFTFVLATSLKEMQQIVILKHKLVFTWKIDFFVCLFLEI